MFLPGSDWLCESGEPMRSRQLADCIQNSAAYLSLSERIDLNVAFPLFNPQQPHVPQTSPQTSDPLSAISLLVLNLQIVVMYVCINIYKYICLYCSDLKFKLPPLYKIYWTLDILLPILPEILFISTWVIFPKDGLNDKRKRELLYRERLEVLYIINQLCSKLHQYDQLSFEFAS